jgi:hypothetical protein
LKFHDIGFEEFLHVTVKAQNKILKIDNWDYITWKLLFIKGHYQKSEKATHNGRKYLQIMYLARG